MRVLGTTVDLPHLLRDNRPDELLIAIPSARGDVRQRIVEACRAAGVPVKTLPGLHELISGDLNLAGRSARCRSRTCSAASRSRSTSSSVCAYVRGKTVLVTGAGGSIGSELCRQLARLGAARLILVEQGESALYEIERELVDERDFPRRFPCSPTAATARKLRTIFERYQPQVVFHAAAYKHVPMLEANPLQAVEEQRARDAQRSPRWRPRRASSVSC